MLPLYSRKQERLPISGKKERLPLILLCNSLKRNIMASFSYLTLITPYFLFYNCYCFENAHDQINKIML